MKKETLFISISNQKGGVGKSVITTLIASYLLPDEWLVIKRGSREASPWVFN